MSQVSIHPTALVEKGAELDSGVVVGPFCRVSEFAKIGKNTRLISHVVIDGHIQMGENNEVHPFSTLGGPPQDLSYKNEATQVLIADNNVFREGVTIHRGTQKDRAITRVGSNNFLMAYSHIAHDCIVGSHNIFANQGSLAGHVILEDYIVIGGLSAVVQKCRVGSYSFIGASTVMRKDLPPYMAAKEFSNVMGPNLVGLRRKGFSADDIKVIGDLYKIYYLSAISSDKAMEEIEAKYASNPHAQYFLKFVRASSVGVQR